MPIAQIADHMAHTCGCGSVNFNLLRSQEIECAGCGAKFGGWSLAGNEDEIKDAYNRGNFVGKVEGIEMSALYHEGIAEMNERLGKWKDDEKTMPFNGPALAAIGHRRWANGIREIKYKI